MATKEPSRALPLVSNVLHHDKHSIVFGGGLIFALKRHESQLTHQLQSRLLMSPHHSTNLEPL